MDDENYFAVLFLWQVREASLSLATEWPEFFVKYGHTGFLFNNDKPAKCFDDSLVKEKTITAQACRIFQPKMDFKSKNRKFSAIKAKFVIKYIGL